MSSRLLPWREFYTQTVTVEPFSGRDSYGNKTYGTAVAYRARVAGKRKLVLTDAGQQVVSQQVCYLYSADPVQTESRLTLSTADVGSTESWAIHPPILVAERFPDEVGQLYTALRLGGR